MNQETLDIPVNPLTPEELENQKLSQLDKEALRQFEEDLLERRIQAVIELEESERLLKKVDELLYE